MTLVRSGKPFSPVSVTNTSGKSTEGVFQVTLLPSQEDNPIEIIASSTRAEIGPGDGQLVIGVLVSGGTVDMMVKGLGPSLPVFGALPDPVLTVFSAQGGAMVAQSDDWQSHASSAEVSSLATPRLRIRSPLWSSPLHLVRTL